MPLEVLHGALMRLSFIPCGECSKIAALAGLWILLARIKAELAGRQFANHGALDDDQSGEAASSGPRGGEIAGMGSPLTRLGLTSTIPPGARAPGSKHSRRFAAGAMRQTWSD